MPTANSGADFPMPGLDHPGGQYLLAYGCDQMTAGLATQARLFPMAV